MPGPELNVFIYVDRLSRRIIATKKSREFDFSLRFGNVETVVVRESEDVASNKIRGRCLSTDGRVVECSAAVDEGYLAILNEQVSTLILLKTNVEMHRMTVENHFSQDVVDQIARDHSNTKSEHEKIQHLLLEEKRVLLDLLAENMMRFENEVGAKTSIAEVKSYYRGIRDDVVLGSYVTANKVDEGA